MPSDPTADPEQSAPDRRLVLAAATAARLAPRRDEAPPPEDWRRVVTAIRTYRWLVIAVTGVGTLAGIIGARFLKPTYQARATVWLEIPDPSAHERDQGPFQSGQLLGPATGWLDLLLSPVVPDDVVRQWRLYLKPQSAADSAALATLTVTGDVRPGRYRLQVAAAANRFRLLDVDAKVVLQEGAVGDSVGATLGFTWVPPAAVLRPGASVQFTVATTSEAAQKLSEELRVRAGTDGNFVRIERRGPDAAVVTRTVNAVAERFVAAAADLKRQRLTELTAILKDQLDRAETNLRAAERGLTAFRVRSAAPPPPVRRLAQQVDTLARRVIPELGRAVVAGLAAREHELRQRIDSISRDLRSAPPVALEEVRLARDQANAEQLFSNLQQRYQEARLAEVSTLPDVRILEPAVRPTRPVSDTAPLVIIVACVMSLGAGVLGAVLLERADPKVRYPDEVTRAIGLPILGAVPHVQRGNGKRRAGGEDDIAKAGEALRGIRLNLQHAYGAAGPGPLPR